MTRILAIDPGNAESAYVVIDHATRRPIDFDKTDNDSIRSGLRFGDWLHDIDHIAIEMVASYGMPVGADVFETCVWIGHFREAAWSHDVALVKRHPVKLHHCHSAKATDANISQALKDRFAHGVRNHGKGTKDQPGFFYGFKADVWQAYALAVYVADTTPLVSRPAVLPVVSTADGASPVTAAGETPQEVLFP